MNPKTQQNVSFLFEQKRNKIRRSFPIMIKITGPVCNLDCDYCYYLEKDALYPGKKFTLASFRMEEQILEKLIKDHITSQPQQRVEFIWHGGEPTLAGISYLKKAIGFQKTYAAGKEIVNALQTNGTLINDEWAEFLAGNHFLCGVSVDGPQKLHDQHRRFLNGEGSWQKVMECVKLFQKYGVEYNIMSVINSSNSKYPALVYDFFKKTGSKFIQFTPIAERIAEDENETLSMVSNDYRKNADIMRENVSTQDWGNFLCQVFDVWVKTDVGTYFINIFDNTLAAYAGQTPSLCSMAEFCGCSPAIEHNGDVYCCDHFVFPENYLGNIFENDLSELVKSDKQLFFEQRKPDKLSQQCKACEFLKACGGDCPKNRFVKNKDGEYISCLCEGFQLFFRHTRKHFEFMANELKNHRAPANIMKAGL